MPQPSGPALRSQGPRGVMMTGSGAPALQRANSLWHVQPCLESLLAHGPKPGLTTRPKRARPQYGVRSRRTRLFGDQLWPADAGSWQIADAEV